MLSDINRPKGVFTPLVVDNILNGDEHAIFRQRVVGRLDQVFLFRQIPVVQDHPHCDYVRFWQWITEKISHSGLDALGQTFTLDRFPPFTD